MTTEAMSDERDRRLAAERRIGLVVGPLALIAIAMTLTAVVASSAAARDVSGQGTLKIFDANERRQLVAVGLRTGSLVLTIPIVWFLHRLLVARDRSVPRLLLALGVIATVSIAVATVVGWFGLREAATSYVEGAYATESAALDASTTLTVSRWMDIGARLLFASWLAVTSLRASRIGLLTPFLGLWGLLAAVTGTFLPVGDALYIGWLASVALMAVGYWPGGRPPSWRTGVAEPWTPAPGSGALPR